MTHTPKTLLFCLMVVAGFGIGCGGGSESPTGTDDNISTTSGQGDAGLVDNSTSQRPNLTTTGTSSSPVTSGGGAAATLTLIAEPEPANGVFIAINGGGSLQLKLKITQPDGMEMFVTDGITWQASPSTLGSISASGVFTPSGEVAGTVTLSAKYMGVTGSRNLTIRIEHTVVGGAGTGGTGYPSPGADPASKFVTAETDANTITNNEVQVLYPLDGTVFPPNIDPADLQWERATAGNVYRITLSKPSVTVTTFVGYEDKRHWIPTAQMWRALAESDPASPVTMTVDRWTSGGTYIPGPARSFRFAGAALVGSVYFWDLPGGKLLRIKGDGTGLEAFMPDPPPSGNQCVACHAISHDGTKLLARLKDASASGEPGGIWDLTQSLVGTDPAPLTSVDTFRFSSWNPAGTHAVVARSPGKLSLINAANGTQLLDNLGGFTGGGTATRATHPAWSPSSQWLAVITGVGSETDFTTGNLSRISVTAGPAFGASAENLVTSSPGTVDGTNLSTLNVPAHPAWSPDSTWIAFQHGSHSRGKRGGQPLCQAMIRLYHNTNGSTLNLKHLNVANDADFNGLIDADNTKRISNLWPTFSPYSSGGYYWLAFSSSRAYGNTNSGTKGKTGSSSNPILQLWVAAIKTDPSPGEDPSAPPFWLPKQNMSNASPTDNYAAQWAPEACRATGRDCSSSAECCSGFCRDDDGNAGTPDKCVPPDSPLINDSCGSQEGDSCVALPCCAGSGLTCQTLSTSPTLIKQCKTPSGGGVI